jgi:phospholipase/carboxylesterase
MKHLFWHCLAFLFSTSFSMAQQQKTTLSKSRLHYLVRQAKITTGKPPLLILLHGLGSNEEDLFSLADQLPAHFLVVSVRAPYTIGPASYAWYHLDLSSGKPVYSFEEAEKSRNTLVQFIGDLSESHSFDPKQIYLGGFSQGGIMSYSVGLTHPELLKGIVVLSGRLLEEVKPKIVAKEKLRSLRIFISHGTKDQTLDISGARSAHSLLKSLGLNPTYKEYIEGHGVNAFMIADLFNWLKN